MQVQDKKKAAILAVLIGFLAVYWGYKLLSPKHEDKPVSKGQAQARRSAAPSPSASIKVDLGLLDRPRERYNASKNMFNPVYKKPALPKPSGKPAGQGVAITVTPQPALPPLPPPPPPRSPEEIAADNSKEEMNKFKIMGFLKRKGRTDVFLSLGPDYFITSKGGNIVKDYYLEDIGLDYIVIADRSTKVEVRLKANFTGEKEAAPPPPKAVPGAPPGPPGMPPGVRPAPGVSGSMGYGPQPK